MRRRPGQWRVTRRYLAANVDFYLTAGVTVLFLHNWFSLLALGADSLDGNDSAWVMWAAVNVLVPTVAGVTACSLWKEAEQSPSGEKPGATG